MIESFRAWRATGFASNRAWYAQLAEFGQRPRAMVIGCCDSRIDVQALLGAEPGALFTVRNVANIAPPYALDHEHHGTSAAIEFAVTVLRVAHVVVMGHAKCGGVEACYDRQSKKSEKRAGEPDEPPSFLDRWIDILAPAYERIADVDGDRATRIRALEKESVLTSMRNLESFPFVREAVANGRLTIHGAWFDISEGRLHVHDPTTGEFSPVAAD
ncbi:MAG: carbonic anhydrase [Pseudomonadota bacterium]